MSLIEKRTLYAAALATSTRAAAGGGEAWSDGLGRRLGAALQPAAVALILPACLVVAWAAASRSGGLPEQILPDPRLVLDSLRELWQSGDLLYDMQVSLLRVAEGFAVGGSIGIGLGIVMGLSPRLQLHLEPLFLAISQVPTLGWIPLLILLVGIDEGLKVTVIAWSACIPVTLNTYKGIRGVPAAYRDVGRVLTFGAWPTLTKIVLPGAVPAIFAGIREGLSNSWQTLVGVELFASSEGLGYLMVWGRQLFQLDLVIVGMIVIGTIGLLLNLVLERVERRLLRWRLEPLR